MKNLHLVPINVVDVVENMLDKNRRENEHNNYVLRVEAIRDYCQEALERNKNKISAVQFPRKRK